MSIVITSTDHLLKYVPFIDRVSYKDQSFDVAYINKQRSILTFNNYFEKPVLQLSLQNPYCYNVNVTYKKDFVPRVRLNIHPPMDEDYDKYFVSPLVRNR